MPLSIVFLDSSVILSGLASPTGGSRKLFDAAEGKKLKLVTTAFIVEEVGEHLEKLNVKPHQLEALISHRTIRMLANPPEETIEKFKRVTKDPDDAHVLAGAVHSGAHVFLSLDKKHLLTLRAKRVLKPMHVMSPKEFWHWLQK